MITEQVKVISIHGEKLNRHFPGAGQALPAAINDGETGTISFEYVSDGLRYNRHVPLSEIGDYQVGQTLTQVTSQ